MLAPRRAVGLLLLLLLGQAAGGGGRDRSPWRGQRTCSALSPPGCPPASCAGRIGAALRSCSASGGGVVRLAPGVFHLNDSAVPPGQPMVALTGLANVSLVGSADATARTTLLIHGYRTGMQLTAGRGVTLAHLELEMARYPYTYGTATSVANTSFELVFDSALYPLQAPGRAAWQYEASSIMGFNAAEWRMASDPVVDLQGSFALAPGAAANRLVVSGAGALAGIADGGSYVLRHAQLGCGGFCFASCTGVLLSHVDVWAAAGVAFWFGSSRSIELQSVGVRRRPGRPMSSIADASHFDSCGGEVLLERNHFEGQGDDGINVHSSLHEVRAISANTAGRFWLGSKPSAGPATMTPLTLGGRYAFRNRRTWALEATATLLAVAVRNSTAGLPTQVADFDFPCAAAAAQVTPFALLSDMGAQPSSVTVRGGYFGANRARGALLKSSNTLVEDTVFNHTAAHCVQAYPDGCWWFEGNTFRTS